MIFIWINLVKIKYMIFMFINILVKFINNFKNFIFFMKCKCIDMFFKNNYIYIIDFIIDYFVCRWCLTIIKYMYKYISKLL